MIGVLISLATATVSNMANADVSFPPLEKSYLKQYPKIEVQKAINLSAINSNQNMTKETVRLLVGNPHFNEFWGNQWNYVFNIRKPATQEYVLCQAQIQFEKNIAISMEWNQPICKYLSQKAIIDEQPKPVVKPKPPVQVVEVKPAPAPESYTLNSDLLFAFDSSTLNPQGFSEIEKIVNTIKDKYSKIDNIKIIGHTDRIGRSNYNLELSKKRAFAVARYLSDMGLSANEVIGVGESQPVTSGCNGISKDEMKQCLFRDRRVDVIIEGLVK